MLIQLSQRSSQEQAARHPAPTRCGRHCSFKHFLTGRFVRVENGELSFLLSFSYHCCHQAPSDHQLPPSPFYNWLGNFMDYFDIAIQAQWVVRIFPLPKPPLFPPFNLHLQISGHVKVTNSSWNFFLLEIQDEETWIWFILFFILFAWFLLFGVFCSLVCFKTFDKHAKIWNKWKSFIRSSIVIFLKVWFS